MDHAGRTQTEAKGQRNIFSENGGITRRDRRRSVDIKQDLCISLDSGALAETRMNNDRFPNTGIRIWQRSANKRQTAENVDGQHKRGL